MADRPPDPAQPAFMAFDPCREWLGIDATDLADPHRVLGLPSGIRDAAAVARAAADRLESLRRVERGPFAKAQAALIARVEEARGTLLAGAETPVELPAAPSPAAAVPNWSPPVARRRRRRRSSGAGPLFATIGLLAAAAAVIAFLFLRDGRTVAFGGSKRAVRATSPEPAKAPTAATGPAAGEAARGELPRPRPAPPAAEAEQSRREAEQRMAVEAERQREAEAEQSRREAEQRMVAEAERQREAEAEQSRREAEQRMAAEAERQREAEAERQRQSHQLDVALGEAYRSIQRQEFDTAISAIDGAADQVGDDADAAARVERWRLFADYAKEYSSYQQQAFVAANAGREYEAGGVRFSVVEITPERFVYKVGGRIERRSPAAVDPRITMAIVEAWFAADGRAANHLFLGARWLSLDPPEIARAQEEWEIAGSGGEAAAPLLELLQDPVIQRASR